MDSVMIAGLQGKNRTRNHQDKNKKHPVVLIGCCKFKLILNKARQMQLDHFHVAAKLALMKFRESSLS
jgi:hypothetical protein